MTTEAHPAPDPLLPSEDADDEWLREAMTKRRVPRLTLLLAVVAVAAIAFMAGVLIEKNYFAGTTTSGGGGAGAGARLARLFGRGATGASGAASGLAAAGVTIGQVKVINGKSFYVTDSSGNTVKVVLAPSSSLTAQKKVSYQTLHPGDTVTIRGQTTGGTVHATSIAIGTAGGAGGFGGRFGGGGGFGGFRGGATGATGASGGSG